MGWLWSDFGLAIGFLVFSGFAAAIFGARRNDKRQSDRPTNVSPPQPAFPSNLEGPIEDLIKSGITGAFLKITFEGFDLVCLIQKYIREDHEYGISVLLPINQEGDHSSNNVVLYCQQSSIPFKIVILEAGDLRSGASLPDTKIKAISIDCGNDTEGALRHLKSIVVDTLGIPETVEFRHRFKGGSRPGELVDDPELGSFTSQESRRFWGSVLRRQTGVGFAGVIVVMLINIAAVFGNFALMYSIFIELLGKIFSIDPSWSAISFEVAGLSCRAKWFDVFWIVVLILTLFEPLTRLYWVKEFRREGKDWRSLMDSNWRPKSAELSQALRLKFKARRNLLILLVIVLWVRF